MLQPDLLEAFECTDYHIFGDAPLIVQPGILTPDADRFFCDRGIETAIVLTAWNPMGIATPIIDNEAAQAMLIEDLNRRGMAHIPAEGRGRDGLWPAEPSLFVLGVTLQVAHELAAAHRQAAFLFLRRGAAPEVIVTQIWPTAVSAAQPVVGKSCE